MKKILFIIMVCLSACLFTEAAPEYVEGQWYIWSAENAYVATNALKYINVDSGFFPIYETRNGITSTTNISTTSWANEIGVLADGRVGFPRLPEYILDLLGIPEAQREAFFAAFQPEAIVVTSDMLPEPDGVM